MLTGNDDNGNADQLFTCVLFLFLFTAFRNWMNSIGVNPFVNNLYRDLCSGLVLLQVTFSLFVLELRSVDSKSLI